MRRFKHIENESLWPKDSDHVAYSEVFRATVSTDFLRVTDFLPWNIEHRNQEKTFKRQFKQPQYGMSVFTDLDALKEKVATIPVLNEKTKAYAKGFTTITRGISLKENSSHHVEYFLFDYKNNSPKDDFSIVEVRSGKE